MRQYFTETHSSYLHNHFYFFYFKVIYKWGNKRDTKDKCAL